MGKSITDLASVTTVGLDLAKHVFQVHGVDAAGRVVVATAVKRDKLLAFFASLPRCLVGMGCGDVIHIARSLASNGPSGETRLIQRQAFLATAPGRGAGPAAFGSPGISDS